MNNTSIRRIKLISLTLAILSAAFLMGLYVKINNEDHSPLHATVLTQPRAMNPFKLKGINSSFSNQNLQGHWTLFFFGFTRCPQLCPTTMTILNTAYQMLETSHVAQLPQVYMITIDPNYDSLSTIENYAHNYNKAFHGLSATGDQLKKLTTELGIVYFNGTGKNNTDPSLINHSGAIMVFGPDGKLHAFFNTPHHAEQIAHDLKRIMEKG